MAADCCLATLDGHAGQHIWRVAVCGGAGEDGARTDTLRVVSGGNDASAQVWEAQLHFGNTSRTNAIGWFIDAHRYGLEELREIAKRYCVAHFRQIRQHARSTLTPLAQHPELMLEIMMDAI